MISFVIPVFNNEQYLSFAVNSILRQTDDCQGLIEVIIVDDGSTDNTPEIADEIAQKYDRVKVIHQENQWIYASMNNGIKAAQGEYIYILNSDDKLQDGTLQLLLNKIDEYQHPDVIWTKTIWCYVDEQQNILSTVDVSEKADSDLYFPSEESVRRAWNYVELCNLTMDQANLYKRDLMLKHPFRNDVYSADTLFNYSIANDVQSMAVLKDVLYLHMIYHTPDRNVSKGKYYSYMHEMFDEIYDSAKKVYDEWNIPESVYMPFIVDRRLKQMTEEIVALSFPNCSLSIDEKVKKIFQESASKKIRDSARFVKREREYESRELNGCKTVVDGEKIPDNSKFVEALLSGVPKNYRENVNKASVNMNEIMYAVNAPENPDKIGQIYYTQDW